MSKFKIVKTQTSEENVSQRTIAFDVYKDDEYLTTFNDVCDAFDYKEKLEKEEEEAQNA